MSLFDGGTATATAPTVSVTSGSSDNAASASPRQAFRRASFWIVFGAIAIVVGIISTIAAGGVTPTDRFGADNAGPTGGRALAEVLRQQGVTVTAAGSADEVTELAADPADTTLMLYDTNAFLTSQSAAELQGVADRIVLVEPTADLLDVFAPDVATAGSPDVGSDASSLAAACSVPAAQRAGSVTVGSMSVQPLDDSDSSQTQFCFPDDSGRYLLAQLTAGSTTVTVLPDSEPFTNEQITRSGNASLALSLLGETDQLIWYLPGLGDLAGGEDVPTVADLTPEWVTPILLLLIVVFVAAAVWRGRRLGPLVIENLPVVVRSRETMEGRARLYQRSSSRGRALDNLRIGTIGRVATMLNLSRTSSVDEVVDATAALLGEPASILRALLRDLEPATDADLVRMSDELLRLERAVRRATSPLGPS
ncbi:DUF4350 domain-containing protein [Naasia lichenicola]|uniref:DUF4350 domain-containing protein n=1 Tax=Naasia lichenicola TaxID=2565933 RepID=UPI00130E4CB2|nr:DUF4350 domain-containing protein [Naasia lichenicola]